MLLRRLFSTSYLQLHAVPTRGTHPHLQHTLKEGQVVPGFAQEEFRERRQALAHRLGPGHHICVLNANPTRFISQDIPYVYRQCSNFYYLTGYRAPQATLLLHCQDGHVNETQLIVQSRSEKKFLWDGPTISSDALEQLSGIPSSHAVANLPESVSSVLGKWKMESNGSFSLWYDIKASEGGSSDDDIVAGLQKALSIEELQTAKHLQGHLDQLRVCKSPAEIGALKDALSITMDAFASLMPTLSNGGGVGEKDIEIFLEQQMRRGGAERFSYPPVVAGGDRGNILHYIDNNCMIDEGEMVLIDAGAEKLGYAADITRTLPIGGCYSPQQAECYDMVAAVKEEVSKHCVEGISISQLNQLTKKAFLHAMRQDLQWPVSEEDVARVFPTSLSHHLGLDVHDCRSVSFSEPLRAGMVITVEPGLYIPHDPSPTPAIPRQYHGIAIRLEDVMQITASEPINLCQALPITRGAIEGLCQSSV